LVTNSTDSDNSILFDGEQLITINNRKPFKYLGAWFSTNKRPTLVQKEIMAEVTINLKKLHFANITEKQAIYIINSVIIPRFLYRLYSSFLTSAQANTLNKMCTQLVKQKAKLARGVPNSFLHNPDIYALTNIAQAQLSALVTTLQKNLNHSDFDSSFLKLRLQQLQDAAFTNISILAQPPIFPTAQTNTQTGQMVLALHALGMQTSRDINDWPCPKKFTNTSINQILIQHPRASYLKEKLNRHNIYCIEQFLNATNTELLTWNQFHHNIKKIPRGQCPHWFHII
jgi:hypothetical protein